MLDSKAPNKKFQADPKPAASFLAVASLHFAKKAASDFGRLN